MLARAARPRRSDTWRIDVMQCAFPGPTAGVAVLVKILILGHLFFSIINVFAVVQFYFDYTPLLTCNACIA